MTGEFSRNAGRITLRLYRSDDVAFDIEFLIDTGFAGEIKLSPYWVGTLRLPKLWNEEFTMADGRVSPYEIYAAECDWAGEKRLVEVVEMVGEPMIGIDLLRNFSLFLEVRDGGAVEIQPL